VELRQVFRREVAQRFPERVTKLRVDSGILDRRRSDDFEKRSAGVVFAAALATFALGKNLEARDAKRPGDGVAALVELGDSRRDSKQNFLGYVLGGLGVVEASFGEAQQYRPEVGHECGHGGAIPVSEADGGILDGFSELGVHPDGGREAGTLR
jgi:hypothetical protein